MLLSKTLCKIVLWKFWHHLFGKQVTDPQFQQFFWHSLNNHRNTQFNIGTSNSSTEKPSLILAQVVPKEKSKEGAECSLIPFSPRRILEIEPDFLRTGTLLMIVACRPQIKWVSFFKHNFTYDTMKTKSFYAEVNYPLFIQWRSLNKKWIDYLSINWLE